MSIPLLKGRRPVLLYSLIALTAAAVLTIQYNNRLAHTLEVLDQRLVNSSTNLSHLVEDSFGQVEILRTAAEYELAAADPEQHFAPLIESLSSETSWGGYALDEVPPPYTPETVGNLTGQHPTDLTDPKVARELGMALALNTFFVQTKKHIPNSAWVYYTSAREFINIYPWVSSENFHITDEVMAHEFFTLGTPENNPERRAFLTEAYIDEYGQGLMVTIAAPVYAEDRFHGTVALDITLQVLGNTLAQLMPKAYSSDQAFVLSKSGQLIAAPGILRQSDETLKGLSDALPEKSSLTRAILDNLPDLKFTAAKGYYLYRAGLEDLPWTLFYTVPTSEVRNAIIMAMVPELVVVLLLFLTIFMWEQQRTASARLQELVHDIRQARDEAANANQSKSMFLANISHDLRTPLNAILGFSEMIEKELLGPVGNERYRDYAQHISASGKVLLGLIDDILDLSKIEQGRIDLTIKPVDTAELLRECLELITPVAEKRGQTINLELAPETQTLLVDRKAIRQVLINVIGNASKFTPQGGRIMISTGLSQKGEPTIRVEDNGPGIPEEEIPRLMQPFNQVVAMTREEKQGHGLGLAIAKALVEAHKGQIELGNRPEGGTVVALKLPSDSLVGTPQEAS